MSADMMVVCEEDNSGFSGKDLTKENYDEMGDAFFVDETSLGEPWHEFGKWFKSRFCGAPGILTGLREHHYTTVAESDIAGVKNALKKMECHNGLDKKGLIEYMKSHVGKHISTENW